MHFRPRLSILLLPLACCLAIAQAVPISSGAAPDFALPDERGKVRHLRDWRGQVVVLNFWAFWCDTWKEEMPQFRRLAAREKELGFKLVCLSVDATRQSEWHRQKGAPVSWPVLLDAGGRVTKAYSVAHVPTVVIVDGAGRIRYAAEAYPGNEAIARAVSQIRRGERVTPWRKPKRKKVPNEAAPRSVLPRVRLGAP